MSRMCGRGLRAAAIALVIVTAGWPWSPAGPASPSLLTYAQVSTGVNKIPAFTTTGEDTQVMNLIYEALLDVDPVTWKIGPSLATRYTVSPDGKTWTFTLRQGVRWQRGYGAFTCDDVKFTWDFHKNPDNHSFWATQATIVDTVSCPTPYTAVIQLQAPYLGFIWNLVNIEPSTGWVMSKAAWEKLGRAGYERTPVGTGPYMLQTLIPNQDVILVRNPEYWGPKPAVYGIDFKPVADSQTGALGVRTGAIDVFNGVDPVTAEQYRHTPGVRVIAKQSLFMDYLEINTTVKPFDNLKVREAMRYAIDYAGLVKSVLRGFGGPGYAGLLLPGMDGYDPAVNRQNTYDPAKAKALLQEAGVALPVRGFFTTYNDTRDVNSAQFVAANLAQVGLMMQPQPLERGTLVQERIKPATPASVLGITMSPDPDFLLSISFISKSNPPAGLNIARYNGIDALYDQQRSAVTPAARNNAIRDIQKKIAEDVPAIELYVAQTLRLVNDRVQHFEPSVLFNGDPLQRVTFGR